MPRKKPQNIADDESLDPYAKERIDNIMAQFPDERLRSEFGLRIRECYFVRAYAVTLNATRSAKIAGYGKTYCTGKAPGLVRVERVSNAIDAIMEEAVNPITTRQTIQHINTAVTRMLSIIKDGEDKAAVMAARALFEYIGGDLVKPSKKKDDPKKDDVPDSEIQESLKRMGVIANG